MVNSSFGGPSGQGKKENQFFRIVVSRTGVLMNKEDLKLVKERLFWSYANLAMAHHSVEAGEAKYSKLAFMIRARLYKGLMTGKMHVGTIFDDEKVKIDLGKSCSYCGSNESLALDHILPRKFGGRDLAENLVYACRSCNSSKGSKDLMEWYKTKNRIPPLLVLRRFLKLVIEHCDKNQLLDLPIEAIDREVHQFSIEDIPVYFPKPNLLTLVAIREDKSERKDSKEKEL